LEVTESFTGIEWFRLEKYLESTDLVVLPGETLERLTGKRILGNLHRVGNV